MLALAISLQLIDYAFGILLLSITKNFEIPCYEQTDPVDTKKSVVCPQTTRYSMARIDQKNPLHFVTAHKKNKKPIKNSKPTTTIREDRTVNKQSEKCDGGNSSQKTSNTLTPAHTLYRQSPVILKTIMSGHQGTALSGGNQWHWWSNQTKWISHGGFVENPVEQRSGRGQLPNGSSPPHPLFPTSSTAPDALRLPNQTHCLSLFHPVKPNQQAETSLGCGQHDVMITDRPSRIHPEDQKSCDIHPITVSIPVYITLRNGISRAIQRLKERVVG